MANDELLNDMAEDMDKAIASLTSKLAQVRTGRASVSLLDSIRVDYYGNPSPLNQVATLAAPDARLITISPWEKSMLGPIEKAILKSELGLNPQNDGKIIRVPVPELSGERRKELARGVRADGEQAKIAIRNIRREYIDLIRSQEKDKEISEDDARRLQTKVQEVTDRFVKQVDKLVADKEKEITEV